MIEVKVPDVGESIAEVRLGPWTKQAGSSVRQDEELVLLETDKVSVALPSPGAGVLTEILKKPGETALVGEVIARIEERAAAPAKTPPPAPVAQPETPPPAPVAQPKTPPPAAPKPKPAPSVPTPPAPVPTPAAPPKPTGDGRVVPMSQLRRTVARRLVEAQRNAALLTTFNEIDMSEVKAARAAGGPAFLERHGVKLGFMSFFVKAVVLALKRLPVLNAELRGEDVVYHDRADIGIAVGGGKGLVVPVLRGADRLAFADVEKAIADFAKRAEEGRLTPEDLAGGTFTITNGGVYGSLLSTPIVNPPQSGILGMHAVQDRPVARGGQVVVRPMMYVALTYDHRLVDGREAVTFLKTVKEAVERPLSLLLDA